MSGSHAQGFPAGDTIVSDFLVKYPFSPTDALNRAHAFLIALFLTTTDYLKRLPDLIKPRRDKEICINNFGRS